jgi:hypothetical protein
MNNKIAFAFNLHDEVEIHPIQVMGRVIALYLCEDGKQYRVRYFENAEGRTEYFYEDELIERKKVKCGFKKDE